MNHITLVQYNMNLHQSCCEHTGPQLYMIGVGSRTWTDREPIMHWLLQQQIWNPVVVSGGAGGADRLVIDCARELGMHWEVFPADWNNRQLITPQGSKLAGFHRNMAMVDEIRSRPGEVIAHVFAESVLSDGRPSSPGSSHVHSYLEAVGISCEVTAR